MANACPKISGACVIELIREDACGVPIIGANNAVRFTGFTQFTLSPNVEAANELVEYNACGDICAYDPGCPVLKGFTATLLLCAINPAVLNILGVTSPIMGEGGASGDIIGGNISAGKNCGSFHMKIWGKTPQNCDLNDGNPYVVVGMSRLTNPVLNADIAFARGTLQTWSLGFNVVPGNSEFEDPSEIFTTDELSTHLVAWKPAASLPTVSSECAFLTIQPEVLGATAHATTLGRTPTATTV